jgi:hypothetical protein
MQEAAKQLLSSEGWRRWVEARAQNGLSRYSPNNLLLILLACPEARYVCGFKQWLALGYCVRKGSKAIRILAPMTVKQCDEGSGEETRRTYFRAVNVFDVSDVDALPSGTPAPLQPPSEPLTGDSHAELLTPLESLASELGYSVRRLALDGSADGWCDSKRGEIVVNASLCANAQVRVLVHELAHAAGGIDYEQYTRERAEVIVDTVTYIVLGGLGLDVSGESIPYVAGWGEQDDVEALTRYASTIDQLARRLESALHTSVDAVPDEAKASVAAA